MLDAAGALVDLLVFSLNLTPCMAAHYYIDFVALQKGLTCQKLMLW